MVLSFAPIVPLVPSPTAIDMQTDKQKKPRHRHSPAQLVALNELYDKNDHPPLDVRTALAERLGMETKTVNAWFQNKRASSKKRTRSGGVQYGLPPVSTLLTSTSSSSSSTPQHPEYADFPDDDYLLSDNYPSRSTSVSANEKPAPPPLSSYYAGNPDHTHWFAESESMNRKMRLRPTAAQTDELRNLFNLNQHPSKEQREILGERIGMRYQSITNWFQNQRSLAKKRKEDDSEDAAARLSNTELRDEQTLSDYPVPSNHPSLYQQRTRSHSPLPTGDKLSRRSSPRRSTTPYSSSITSLSRPRRTRPEPHQLDALKELYKKTATPSIEERTSLAIEIGMDVGKVTNWFRNLRQTARKRTKKGSGDDDDADYDGYIHHADSTSVSRSGTPSLNSSSSSSTNEADEPMDLDNDDYDMHGSHSDLGSEDEYQEAVTPSPSSSPPPPSFAASRAHVSNAGLGLGMVIDPASYAELEKASAARFGVKVEDALLLLSFHRHIVH